MSKVVQLRPKKSRIRDEDVSDQASILKEILVCSADSSGGWRDSKAKEYPMDAERNENGAKALFDLSAALNAIPDTK
jgi:hypothetical protein